MRVRLDLHVPRAAAQSVAQQLQRLLGIKPNRVDDQVLLDLRNLDWREAVEDQVVSRREAARLRRPGPLLRGPALEARRQLIGQQLPQVARQAAGVAAVSLTSMDSRAPAL